MRAGDLVYNRLFAWKGSFALIPAEFEGCFVSNEFPLFYARDGADIRYVAYYFQQPWLWDYIAAASTGATAVSRNRWREERFRNLLIPVPPPATQHAMCDLLDREFARTRRLLSVFSSSYPPGPGTLSGLLVERRDALITAAITGQLQIPGVPA